MTTHGESLAPFALLVIISNQHKHWSANIILSDAMSCIDILHAHVICRLKYQTHLQSRIKVLRASGLLTRHWNYKYQVLLLQSGCLKYILYVFDQVKISDISKQGAEDNSNEKTLLIRDMFQPVPKLSNKNFNIISSLVCSEDHIKHNHYTC